MDQFSQRSALRIENNSSSDEEVYLAVEEPLEIRVNGEPYAVVMRTPGNEIELAAGFCLTEGIVDSLSDIMTMGFCPDADETKNIVNMVVREKSDKNCSSSARSMASRSSCGICGIKMLGDLEKELSPLSSGIKIGAHDLEAMQAEMWKHQDLFRRTKATHAVCLASADGKMLAVREDVGRHNAMDKVIGFAMLNGIDCTGCAVFLSSRISYEMVQKAIRAKIPVVAAVSAATSLAVDLAGRFDCTLVGRVRDDGFVVYSGASRIVSSAPQTIKK